MQETLSLFANVRAIKQFYENSVQEEGFLPQAQTLGAFIESLIYVQDKTKIPSFLRPLFLHQAIKENKHSRLGDFGENFADFLENSSFFFHFYDELGAGCVPLESLENLDIYAFYDDHLQVLKKIFASYLQKLSDNGFYDHPFFENFFLALELLNHLKKINVYLEGFLSRFEEQTFQKISQVCEVNFYLSIDEFNQDYYQNLWDLKLDLGFYSITLKSQKYTIETYSKSLKSYPKIQKSLYPDKITEVGGIFAQIDTWLTQGIAPEQICVVLSDENFMSYLELFDEARNFNYAMGRALSDSQSFKILEEKILDFKDLQTLQSYLKTSEDFEILGERDAHAKILETLQYFIFLDTQKFSSYSQMALLFLEMLRGERLDDIGGGRINVIGILETRGLDLEFVILPEFNEDNIPKPNDKDIFLSTKIRQRVGLPTRANRANLQKHYYNQLINKAKEVFITAESNDETAPSRFLLEEKLFRDATQKHDEKLAQSYFIQGEKCEYQETKIQDSLPKSFSPTSLECFLTCKRKYYYQYIKRFCDSSKETFNLGSLIHQALYETYRLLDFSTLQDSKNLPSIFEENFTAILKNQNLTQRQAFETQIAKKYLERFFANEIQRIQAGWIPSYFEYDISFSLEDITFSGRVDRVDKRGEEILILDYKYKKNLKLDTKKTYPNAKNFQLALYALAFREQTPLTQASQIRAGYYDLYGGKIEEEGEILADKQNLLNQIIKELKNPMIDFEKCESKEPCRYCSYVYLCHRY